MNAYSILNAIPLYKKITRDECGVKSKPLFCCKWSNYKDSHFEWTDYHKSNCESFVIVCGKVSNVVAIDFDSEETFQKMLDYVAKVSCEPIGYSNDLSKHSITKYCNYIYKTTRGYRLFFRYTPEVKSMKLDGIDVLSDNKIDYCNDINEGYELIYDCDFNGKMTLDNVLNHNEFYFMPMPNFLIKWFKTQSQSQLQKQATYTNIQEASLNNIVALEENSASQSKSIIEQIVENTNTNTKTKKEKTSGKSIQKAIVKIDNPFNYSEIRNPNLPIAMNRLIDIIDRGIAKDIDKGKFLSFIFASAKRTKDIDAIQNLLFKCKYIVGLNKIGTRYHTLTHIIGILKVLFPNNHNAILNKLNKIIKYVVQYDEHDVIKQLYKLACEAIVISLNKIMPSAETYCSQTTNSQSLKSARLQPYGFY